MVSTNPGCAGNLVAHLQNVSQNNRSQILSGRFRRDRCHSTRTAKAQIVRDGRRTAQHTDSVPEAPHLLRLGAPFKLNNKDSMQDRMRSTAEAQHTRTWLDTMGARSPAKNISVR
eukprot:7130126-Prymnesium_polylepis.2